MTTTEHIGQVTTPPDSAGWQVVYDVGLQKSAETGDEEVVIVGLAVVNYLGTPSGGLTAQTARSLLKPGTALREFIRQVTERRATWPVTVEEVERVIETQGAEGWRSEPTPEFVDYATWLRTLPQFRQRETQPASRRQRIALTAAQYVDAINRGERAPRKRVAELQGRSDGAVRDDLHAARVERPELLEDTPTRGRSGGQLTEAAHKLLEEMGQ